MEAIFSQNTQIIYVDSLSSDHQKHEYIVSTFISFWLYIFRSLNRTLSLPILAAFEADPTFGVDGCIGCDRTTFKVCSHLHVFRTREYLVCLFVCHLHLRHVPSTVILDPSPEYEHMWQYSSPYSDWVASDTRIHFKWIKENRERIFERCENDYFLHP